MRACRHAGTGGGGARWQHVRLTTPPLLLVHPCRQNVVQAPHQLEGEAKRQEALQAVLAAPRPSETAAGGDAAAGPAGMEGVQQAGEAAMAVDGQAE